MDNERDHTVRLFGEGSPGSREQKERQRQSPELKSPKGLGGQAAAAGVRPEGWGPGGQGEELKSALPTDQVPD